MTLGLVQYVAGQKHLRGAGELKEDSALPERIADARRKLVVALGVVLGLGVAIYGLLATGVVSLPNSFTWCAGDADCTVVSLGCENVVGVNRAHASVVHRSLQASGRAYRPPKDACGPGADGTMHGVAGECRNSACQIPKWPK